MNRNVPNPVLYYSAPDYSTSGQRLMGMQSANEGFLRGYVTHSGQEEFLCFASDAGFEQFTQRVRSFSGLKTNSTRQVTYADFSAFRESGCFYLPSIQIDMLAWQRRRCDQRAYSVCGLTHTTASSGAMASICNAVFGPTQPWDALICTSKAVKESCEYVIQTWCDYCCQRFGTREFKLPLQLPLIPLGVNAPAYERTPEAEAVRRAWRRKFEVADDDVAFLFVGRLSAHAKAHPIAMYRALEEATRRTSARVHLIQAGWFSNPGIEQSFHEGARKLSPSVRHLFVNGRNPEALQSAWRAADVFISLADNIQETFGLTPIEAMAAGLPVVVADWDGYRDTVRDGIDGFRIPTLAPPPHSGHDLAFMHEVGIDNYDHYIGNACQITSVDVAASTSACLKLIESPALRRQMGAAGKQRARDVYDWKHVIAAYQELWQELDERRRSHDESVPLVPAIPANPARNDPFAVFASYPTAVLRDEDALALRPGRQPQDFQRVRAMPVNNFGWTPADEVGVEILERLEQAGPCTLGELTAEMSAEEKTAASRALLWSAKADLVSIGSHNAGSIDKPPI